MHFDLVDLRLIVRVADANSLTKGAEASHISLPAASTRIKNLEDSIGAKLLYRASQGVTLTAPGQALVRHARLMLGQIEHLRGDLQEYAKGIKGHVRVFANTTALEEFLPPVLKAYLLAHPDVNIDLRERLSHDTCVSGSVMTPCARWPTGRPISASLPALCARRTSR
jgi:DNA-binding transcriptional LysR family regulator